MKPQKIKLGAHDYTVRPQPIGYLLNGLGPDIKEALEREIEGVEGAPLIGAKAYDTLKVFIPDLMPLHEFLGFASEEALHANDYDREQDHSPDAPQVTAAFKTVKTVNGGEVLDALKAALGPLWTQLLKVLMAEVAESGILDSISLTSDPSPISPSMSGGSDSTSSFGPNPTPTVPESAG